MFSSLRPNAHDAQKFARVLPLIYGSENILLSENVSCFVAITLVFCKFE